jgi:hypothetical protein
MITFHVFILFQATLETDSGEPLTYITLTGDYNALNASGLLEIKRAIIYNYLLSIGMPIVSDLTLYSGKPVSELR